MKTTFIKHLFIYLSAAYFLIGGTGYNVVNYCCQNCANEGIEEIEMNTCFNIHHHINSKESNRQHNFFYYYTANQESENCRFLRVNTDIPSYHAQIKLHVEQFYVVYLFTFFNNSFSRSDEEITHAKLPPPESLLSKSGRFILTFHSVLLI